MTPKTKSVVDLLIKKGADVNATNKEGATALHKATEIHNVEVMASLLRQGAKVSGSHALFGHVLLICISKPSVFNGASC